MKGFEVIAETRRRSRQHAPWLMLMSAAADLDKIEMASKASVDDFLLKPVNEMDLLVRLRTAERVQHLYHELQEQMQAVRFHASHDSLTGLLNREAMMRLLFQETDRVQRMRTPLTLMLIDLDKFSEINTEFGYGTGDAVLREFTQRLRRYLRSYDIIGRCGEDEFLVGLPGCLADQAAVMAERLQTIILEKPYHIHRDVFSVTASIGIATSRGRSPSSSSAKQEKPSATPNSPVATASAATASQQSPSRTPTLPNPTSPSSLPEKGCHSEAQSAEESR